MKYLSYALVLLSLNVFAEELDWRSFVGTYDYVECSNNGHPVWGVDLKNRFVHIFEDRADMWVNDLQVSLFQKKYSPLVLRWSIDHINQNIYHRIDYTTNKVVATQESFTNQQGLTMFYRWEWPDTSGWQTIDMRWVDAEKKLLEYETTLYHSANSNPVKKEKCRLIRLAKFPDIEAAI